MNWITKFIKPKIKSLFKKKLLLQKKLFGFLECKNLIYKEDFKKILIVVLNVEHIINYLVKIDLNYFLIMESMK